MSKKVGGVTYEARYFIVEVPDEWQTTDPLPASGPNDQWFERMADFVTALGAPWNHAPVNRRPWPDEVPARPDNSKRTLGRLG